jgi:hypothetical protein
VRLFAATVIYLALLVQVGAAEWRELELPLPRALQAGETVFLVVKVGAVPRGKEIEVTTASGRALGVISPYGVRVGQETGTYTLPVPPDIFIDGHAIIRLFLDQTGHPRRPPSIDEVKSVRVKIGPAAR